MKDLGLYGANVELFDFFVPGIPITQGSKKIVTNRRTGRPQLIEVDDKRLNGPDGWRTAVANAGRWQMHTQHLMEGREVALILQAVFTVPRPVSLAAKYLMPNVKPDGDKYMRAVGDALTRIVYKDDGMITDYEAHKRYPGILGGAPETGVRLVLSAHIF